MRWLPTITGFMALGLLLGPSGLGLLLQEALSGAKVLFDIAMGLRGRGMGSDSNRFADAPRRRAFQVPAVGRRGHDIGLVQTTRGLMPELGVQVSARVLAAVAFFETIGPPIAAMALRLSGDAGRGRREAEAAAAAAPTAKTANH